MWASTPSCLPAWPPTSDLHWSSINPCYPPVRPLTSAPACPSDGPPPTPRVGGLSLARTELLKLKRGSDRGALKDGQAVVNTDGLLVTSEMVTSPVKPGRKIAFIGTCLSPGASPVLQRLAHGVDLLVHGGVVAETAVEATAGGVGARRVSTAAAAGRLAAELKAECLVLGRFNAR